jgi:hypothetical protein
MLLTDKGLRKAKTGILLMGKELKGQATNDQVASGDASRGKSDD